MQLLEAIFTKKDLQLKNPDQYKSMNWLKQRLQLAMSKDLIDAKYLTKNIFLGRMYLFCYYAKHAAELDYFDVNPLVIPLEKYDDGFLGVNFHYLHPKMRKIFFDRLNKYITGTNINTRYKISYDLLTASSSLLYYKPTIKRYLYSQIKSRVLLIPADEWQLCTMLPMAKFVGVSGMNSVYKDSLNIIRDK